MGDRVSVAIYSALGGPETERMGDDGFPAGPTDEGEYRVAYCGRHSSERYPTWSKIPWGSKLKDDGKVVSVLFEGKWQELSSVVALNRDDVVRYHNDLYRVPKVPSRWVYNDFGHVTCYLYQDLNLSGRREKDEKIHGEFLHTTPIDEAKTALGQKVSLTESHGCVHLRPTDIDEMIRRGFLRKNAPFIVHSYADRKVIFPRRGHAVPPYEMHFFPSMGQIVVVGNER